MPEDAEELPPIAAAPHLDQAASLTYRSLFAIIGCFAPILGHSAEAIHLPKPDESWGGTGPSTLTNHRIFWTRSAPSMGAGGGKLIRI